MKQTQLIIGPHQAALTHALSIVHHVYPHADALIARHQFHALLVTVTVKSVYTRMDLEPIFAKIALARTDDEPFFCIVTQAAKLSDATANSLLKVLEEPPIGWHWLLLSERPHELLDTVRSRCAVTQLDDGGHAYDHHELFQLLTRKSDLLTFHQVLERAKISEYESRLLLDKLITLWVEKSKQQLEYAPVVTYVHSCLERLPMPGSSKIFWRNVYLGIQSMLHSET